MRWTLTLLACLAVAFTFTSSAQAGSLGRYFGLGSGPGYHAYNNCPTVPRHAGPGHAGPGHHHGHAHQGPMMGPVYAPAYGPLQETEVIESPVELPTPAKLPSSSRRTSEPQLPSQRMSHKPVFWYK